MTLNYKHLAFFLFVFTGTVAQVGIGTTTPEGALDVSSANSGVVVPRVTLTSKTDLTTVVNPQGGNVVNGTLVWNTATAGVAPDNVVPGFYYYTHPTWTVLGGDTTRQWSLSGNAVTDPATEFIGTTSNQDFRVRTNNNERFTFTSNGRFRIHNDGDQALPIISWNADQNMGIFRVGADVLGFSTNALERFRIPNAYQVHAMNSGSAAAPFYSFGADTNTGMYHINPDILLFSTAGTERLRITANGQVSVNNAAPATGDLFSATTNATNNYAINGYNAQTTGSAIYAQNSSTANAFSAIEGVSNAVNGGGVFGINSATAAGIRIGVKGESNSGFYNRQIGVQGSYSGLAWGIGVMGIGFGGGVPAGNNDVAVMGWVQNNSNFSGYFNGNHAVVNGTKSASVGTSKGNQLLYVTESPEVWFEDIGRAKLVNGQVTVKLDPLFIETIFVDEEHPMSVFLQEEGESNGLYVIVGKDGFTVKEKNGGNSNISFSYRIMAKRLHFQDHRFGNDPMWGGGDTRKYNEYAPPPPVDHEENKRFQEERRKNYKPSPKPAGFTEYDSKNSLVKPVPASEETK